MTHYLFAFCLSLCLSLLATPLIRYLAIRLNIYDHPSNSVKTHTSPVPYLGGVAIFIGFNAALLWIRVNSSFPSGTLRSLRGILLGGLVVFILGVVDDIKQKGLHYRTKFFFQIIAALIVIYYGVRIRFVQPAWLAYSLTVIWIVGLTNAFNLIDIMDGLASGIAAVCALGFLFISLPTEEIYVNFTAAAIAGAALGFFPNNLSKKFRIFMGDGGSLFLGFILSVLALGTSYSEKTEVGVFAPLVILGLPIFDTCLVFIMRIKRGISPFLGSKDHFALRMEALGWKRPQILIFSITYTIILSYSAYLITRLDLLYSLIVYLTLIFVLGSFTSYVLKHKLQA